MKEEIKLLMSLIERYVKGGRVSFQLIEKSESDKLLERELCVDFTGGEPRLYIKNNNGEIVPIKSKAEDLIEEFLIKFVQVSVDKKYDSDPSLFFKLINETGGFNPENIQKFYKYIEQNFSQLVPYIQYAKTYGGEEKALVPYVTTDVVYFDLGQLINDKGITNVSTTLKELYIFLTDFKDSVNNIITRMDSSISGTIDELKGLFNSLKQKYSENDKLLNDIEVKINQVRDKYMSISGDIDRAYVEKSIRTGNGALRTVSIINGNKYGLIVGGSSKAKPSSPIIAILENGNGSRVVVELGGNGYITHTNGKVDDYIVRNDYNGGNQSLYDVKSVSNGWELCTSGNINIKVLSRGGDVDISERDGGSQNANAVPPYNRIGVFHFSPSVLVANNIVMGDCKLDIG